MNLLKPFGIILLSACALFTQADVAIASAKTAELTPEQLAEQQRLKQREQWRSEIVQLSGLTGLSQQARNLAQQALNEQQAALGYQYQVAGRIAQFWNPSRIENRLQQALQNTTDQELRALRQLLADDRLQAARSKESLAVNDQGGREFQTYVQKLRRQPPTPSRLAVVKELDKAMHFSDLMRQTRASVYAQLQAVLKDWRPQDNWQKNLQTEVQEFLLYTYRRTPNDGIRELTSLYRDQSLQQWLAAVKQALPQHSESADS